jgi:hypothetical protein
MFCTWQFKQTGIFFRLPTEACGEYACKAGERYALPTNSMHLTAYAWFSVNRCQKYKLLGSLRHNAWGIYYMPGNVPECTLDGWTNAYFSQTPVQTAKNLLTVPHIKLPIPVEGGSYRGIIAQIHPALRKPSDPVWNRSDPQVSNNKWWNNDAPFVGFRVVRLRAQSDAAAVEACYNQFLINKRPMEKQPNFTCFQLVEFQYADATIFNSPCRYIPCKRSKEGEVIIGAKGCIYRNPANITDLKGHTSFKCDKLTKKNIFLQQQHDDHFAAIANQEYNCEYDEHSAMSSSTPTKGGMATYSGQLLDRNKLHAGKLSIMPKKFTRNAEPSILPNADGFYPVAVRGLVKYT